MIGIAATLVPTPSPSPLGVHVVTDGAPWWWVPVLLQAFATGFFVLAAALIALKSLEASDKRKLEREDQRQWDSERKAAFVAISSSISQAQVEMSRFGPGDHDAQMTRVLEHTEEAMRAVRQQVKLLEVIAGQPLIDAAKAVQERLAELWQDALAVQMGSPDSDNMLGKPIWLWTAFKEVDELVDALRARVREEIRVDSTR